MTPEQALPILDHASRASDRWLFLSALVILGLFGSLCIRWLVVTFVALVARLEQVLERNAEAFREISESIKMCNSRRGPPLILLLGLLAAMSAAASLHAGSVVVAWHKNPEPYVAGYVVYSGRASRAYTITNPVTGIGNTNSPLMVLPDGAKWYFAVTAVGTNGAQSDFSDEISVDWTKPSAPGGVKIQSVTFTVTIP